MIRDGHIDLRQAAVLAQILITAKVFVTLPRVMAERAGSAAWILILIGGVVAWVGLFFITRLSLRFPKYSLIELTEALLGPVFGRLVGLLFIGYFLYVTSIVMREFTETFKTAILPDTPPSVLTIVMLSILMYAAYCGLEALARASELLFPFIVVSFFAALLVWPNVRLGFLRPFWGPGIPVLLKNGLLAASIYGEILFLAMIFPFLRQKGDAWRAGTSAILVSGIILSSLTALAVAVFSDRGLAQIPFPMLTLARLVNLGKFLQRVEAVYVFVWFFTGALKLSIAFYVTVLGTAQLLKLEDFRPLIWPYGLLVFSLSFIPRNLIEAFTDDIDILRRYGTIVAFLLPAGLWLLAVMLGKRGDDRV
ncbi:MAG: GerAB/ArcD/ProY family transporter [Syntrophothermus sp.]